MISVDRLTERKTTVEADITKVEEALRNLEGQREQLQANIFALQGALQHIDFFMEESKEENK